MANLSNINNVLRVSSSGVGLNKNNTGPSELDIESAGADMIDMTRTGLKTYRFAISGSSNFSIFDVGANDDRLIISSGGDATFSGDIYGNDRLYLGTKMALDVNGTDLFLGSTTSANHNDTVYIRTNDANRVTITDSNVDIISGVLTLGVADTSSANINAFENMTFNIDTDNDDTSRYFAFYTNAASGGGTELLKILESGDATFAGDVILASGKYLGIGNTTPAGTRSKLGVSFNVTGTAATLAESVTYATMELYPYRNGSTYGMFFGNRGTTDGYIQSVDNTGSTAGAININPFGGNVGIGMGNSQPNALLNLSQAAGANIRFDNPSTGKYFTIGEGVGTNNVFSFRGNSYRSTDTMSIDFVNDRVGIGTISPGDKLEIKAGYLRMYDASSNINAGYPIRWSSNNGGTNATFANISGVTTSAGNRTGDLYFSTSNGGSPTEKMRITSDGKVGINTNAPDADLQIITAGSSDEDGVLKIGGSAASLGLVIDYDQSNTTVAKITSNPTYTNTDSLMKLCVDGDANSDQLVLTGGGHIIFGNTSVAGATGGTGSAFGVESNGRRTLFQGTTSTSAMTMQAFYNPNGQVGRIALDGSSTTYYTSSDYRLKEDLQNFNGLEKISKIPVYDFKWKVDESRSYGVLAHELQEVIPDAVGGEKDAINEDESINPQGVDYSKIVPILIKSIQELEARIKELENN